MREAPDADSIMERGYSLDRDEGFPAMQLAKMLDGCIVSMFGTPVIRPVLVEMLLQKHWSKISLLAHKIHDEEKSK